jgi:hypothetical protein
MAEGFRLYGSKGMLAFLLDPSDKKVGQCFEVCCSGRLGKEQTVGSVRRFLMGCSARTSEGYPKPVF